MSPKKNPPKKVVQKNELGDNAKVTKLKKEKTKYRHMSHWLDEDEDYDLDNYKMYPDEDDDDE